MSEVNPSPETTPEQFRKLSRQIWRVGLYLMGFALLVTFVGTTDWTTHWHMYILLPLIVVQASFQVWLFMHLKSEKSIIFKFLFFTIFFFGALFFLTHLAESNPLHSTVLPGH